ncbi:MAG: hypothetical protein JWQ71_4216 [Pedosphaera sp.]|nr:hypothetical protein [Pedosphaera sp.]
MNEVGTKGEIGKIVDDRNGGVAEFGGDVAQLGAVRDQCMSAILQAEGNIPHIEFAASPVSQRIIGNEYSHEWSGLILFDVVPHSLRQRQQVFAQADHVLVMAHGFLFFAVDFVIGKFIFSGLQADAIGNRTQPFG